MLPVGVTAQWLKFLLNKFHERFQICEICEIKDPRNISAIRYCFEHDYDYINLISLKIIFIRKNYFEHDYDYIDLIS